MTDRRHKHDDYGSWRNSFHRRPENEEEPYDYVGSPNPKRLYRSRKERVIGGVCGGIAERFGWEPTLVRLATVVAFLVTSGGPILIGYVILWMITPQRPLNARHLSPDEETFWRGVSDKPSVTFSNIRYKFLDLEDRLQSMERAVTSDEWRLRKQFRDLERGQ
ncbi:MAG: envelope stress response membrane protein PspC [Ponticaulis sp.]|nr:envelope stress response membrane protein PspC [Ponticaulis sp.]